MPTIRYLFELGPFKEYVKTYSEIVFFDEGLDKTNEQAKVSDIDIDNFEYFLFGWRLLKFSLKVHTSEILA
jgi:hypothetical protein